MNLTHLNEQNLPKMVDVSAKQITHRTAFASGQIAMSEAAFCAVKNNTAKKGPVLQTAVVAAVMGAKKTSEIIPMCHVLALNSVDITIDELPNLPGFRVNSRVETDGKTGVEMEALNAVSIGLLTIYDMVKSVDKGMQIGQIQLDFKSGGASGEFKRG